MPLTPAERAALIERYAAGPARLRAALAAVPAALMQRRPAADDWSPHEIASHCADSETNASLRIRYLVGEREPVIMGYDENGWATRLDYRGHPLEPALAVVDAVRANTVALIRRLPDEAWSRAGTHTESGAYSAEDWLRIYAAHLEDHAAQVGDAVARMR
jgi:hypothetical protein